MNGVVCCVLMKLLITIIRELEVILMPLVRASYVMTVPRAACDRKTRDCKSCTAEKSAELEAARSTIPFSRSIDCLFHFQFIVLPSILANVSSQRTRSLCCSGDIRVLG